MEATKVILTLIKDEQIRQALNPLVYYALKLMYSPYFTNRSKYFALAIKKLFENLGNNLDLQIEKLNSNLMAAENSMMFDTSIEEEVGPLNQNENNDKDENKINEKEGSLNFTENKDSNNSINKLMKNNWRLCFNKMVDFDDEYILDKDDNYILLRLIKEYIFGETPASESTLMLCYNIFSSSIELMFCFKLVLSFPNYYFMRKEKTQIDDYTKNIKKRVENFFDDWLAIHWDKYKKNRLIKEIIGPREKKPEIKIIKKEKLINKLNMHEPKLNNKYTSFTKLIKEGPFCFDVEEIARQICLIDHELLSSLKPNDYIQYLIKTEVPKNFEQFFIRERQLQCYIIILMNNQSNLENKKNIFQNFIALAQTLKYMGNQQTSSTIIMAFNLFNITKKNLLWKLVEQKYKDIYLNLEKEVNDVELNENPIVREKKENGCVPHIRYITTLINYLVIQMKSSEEEQKINICNDFKELLTGMEDNSQKKYLFFKMNPLYDFFKFGFLEIFKPERWGFKSRFDFSFYTTRLTDLDQLFNYLVKNYQSD